MAGDLVFEHVPATQRYVASLDGELAAELIYREEDGAIVLAHTVVRPDLRGGEIGSQLVQHVLDDVRPRGLPIVAECTFVAAYLRRHPEAGAEESP